MTRILAFIVITGLAATSALAFNPQPDPPKTASTQTTTTTTKPTSGPRTLSDYNIQKE
jgi:hypothetical protein